MNRLYFSIGLSATLLLSGCSSMVHSDSVRLRKYALSYYDSQIMDNLVRAHEGKLILHVDIDTITAATKAAASGTVGGGRTSDRTTAAGAVTRALSKPFTYSADTGVEDTQTFSAKPVVSVGGAPLYAAYLQFLCLDDPDKPLDKVTNIYYDPDKGAHTIVKSMPAKKPAAHEFVAGTYVEEGGASYYVPTKFRRAYFELCMALTGKVIISDELKDAVAAPPGVAATPGRRTGRVSTLSVTEDTIERMVEEKARDEILRLRATE